MDKILIINDIVSLNPTGILDFNGTYLMKGNSTNTYTSSKLSSDALNDTLNNKIKCNKNITTSTIENFENNYKINDIDNFLYYNKIIYILFIIILVLYIYNKIIIIISPD